MWPCGKGGPRPLIAAISYYNTAGLWLDMAEMGDRADAGVTLLPHLVPTPPSEMGQPFRRPGALAER